MGTFHKAAEIVRNGLIGKITRVEVGLPDGQGSRPMAPEDMLPSTPPPELDYDTWIGPSKMMPYIQGRVHREWRWNYNTGGGQLLDWIGHHCDIAHWGCDFDNSGPFEIEGKGEFPPVDAVWNTCTKYRIELKYPRDITMTIAGGHPDIRGGTKWIGTDGWVWVDRGAFEASNEEWREYRQLPEELRKVKLPISSNHHRNFLESVKSRKPTITPVETAHHSAIPGHLGLISMLVGRRLKWDAQTERILGDADASKLLSRPYRAPWKLGLSCGLELELRYLLQLAALHGGLVGDDAGDGHVQGLGDIHQRLAVLEDGRDELVHQVAVRPAVAAGFHTGRQRRTLDVGQVLLQPFVLAVVGAFLPANPAHLPAVTGRIPTDPHPRHAPFAGAEQGDFRAEGILVSGCWPAANARSGSACPCRILR